MTINPVIQHLIDQLTYPDPETRIAAADALGQFAASNEDTRGLIEYGVPALANSLHDPDRDVRWAAAYALGALGDGSTIPPLENAYRAAGDDTGLRLVIVKALGKTHHRDALPTLIDIQHTADSRCLKVAASKAVARIDMANNDQVVALLRTRHTARTFDASDAACNTLRALGSAALPGLLHAISQPGNPNLALHWEDVIGLADLGAAAVDGLSDLLVSPQTPTEARWAIGEALGYIQHPSIPPLLEALNHPDPEIRRISAYTLIHAADQATIPILIAQLGDPDPEVDLALLKAIMRKGTSQDAPGLRSALSQGRCVSATAAQWVIHKLEAV